MALEKSRGYVMEKFLYRFECFLKKEIDRKSFLRILFMGLLWLVGENRMLKAAFAKADESNGRPKKSIQTAYDLVVAEGPDPAQNTRRAIEALGGMKLFVKKGDVVVVKPNMAWDRNPEQAGNTNPQVVAALVEMAYQAGAKRVNVFDVPCNVDQRVYKNSGIQKAAEAAGAKVYFADHWNVVKAKFDYSSSMNDWPILRDAVKCDVFINVPILKHHALTGLTLSMKNLMGVCSGMRGVMHMGIAARLVDMTDYINPELTVIDATRVLLRNGPSGGDLADVQKMDKIIAATDPVLADSYAAKLMNKDPLSISYIREAADRKFGSVDLANARIFSAV